MKNQKELRRVIKHLVRESLMEILSEQLIETAIRKVMREQKDNFASCTSVSSQPVKPRYSLTEAIGNVDDVLASSRQANTTPKQRSERAETPSKLRENRRQELLSRITDSDPGLAYALQDTAMSDNPILAEADYGQGDGYDETRQEGVPEEALAQLGLMKDYSHLVK
jgi:DNA-binding HxlR family transcriptional regulator